MLAVAGDGSIVDGDEIIAEVALELKRRGELPGNGVAVTVMTNFGFHSAMRDAGIEVATTDVGDRHVVEELANRGWVLGGEQSGHIVDMRLTPSGDGIAAALLLLQALGERPLSSGAAMTKLPQVLTNVPVADREALSTRRRGMGGGRVRVRRAGGRGPGAGAAVGHRAGRAGDGGGTHPGALRGDLRPRGGGRRAGARARRGGLRTAPLGNTTVEVPAERGIFTVGEPFHWYDR